MCSSDLYTNLRSEAHRKGELVAIPIAGDDKEAVATTDRLVRDAGFEPVMVGPLAEAKRFDVDTPTYVKVMTAAQLRSALGLPAK